ncbi:ABC transporter ATP-binding protein [Ruminococcaceae bacterium OttesenSCG-928-A16]|nr:ABC transporter ATP-binding protein [Ruminococcaceae bacterium OttesenSCG-928-A16]
MAQPIVQIDGVSMRFNIAKEKVDSFKEWFIRKAKGQLRFEEFFAVKDVSLTIEAGDVYGLVGLNGSGKSTLLKIVAGVLKPTTGKCTVRGTVAPLIELGAGFDAELTGRENVYLNGTVLGMNPKYIDQHYQDIVEFAELGEFMDVAVKNYSSGMVARLAFAVATITKPDVLICDEILSVGDFLFQQKCEVRMRELMSGGTTVLIVSHDIEQIERLCNKAAWMRRGKIVIDGSCEEVCEAYKTGAQEMRERE